MKQKTIVNPTADFYRDGNDMVVTSHGKEIYRKPRTPETILEGHGIYMAEKYGRKEQLQCASI